MERPGEETRRGAAEVVVRLRTGSTLRGRVATFNPRQPTFMLQEPGERAPRQVAFVEVKLVAFLRELQAPEREVAFPASARLLTVRFADGEALHGVTHSWGGERLGLFLVPTGADWYERVYVPMTAVNEILDVQRLGDILAGEGMLTREQIERAVARQRELREERIGEILVRRRLVTRETLDRSLSLQGEPRGRRIGEILVEQGFITQPELDEALEAQAGQRRQKIGEVLVEMGLATWKMIGVALAIQFGVPFMDLSSLVVDRRLRELVPEEAARRLHLLPVSLQQGVLTVAVADPTDDAPKQELRERTGTVVIEVVATEADIERGINKFYTAGGAL